MLQRGACSLERTASLLVETADEKYSIAILPQDGYLSIENWPLPSD